MINVGARLDANAQCLIQQCTTPDSIITRLAKATRRGESTIDQDLGRRDVARFVRGEE
jgi:hypothetical protein